MSETHRTRLPKFVLMLVISACILFAGVIIVLYTDSPVATALAAMGVLGAWFVPVLFAVRYRDRAKLLQFASKADVSAVIAKVEEARAKESRHEYHQERSLERIEDELRRVHVLSTTELDQDETSGLDVLFVTSNGAGLGHISRLYAIAKHLPVGRKVEFLTMSTAYERMAGSGFTFHYFPSGDAAEVPPETWNPIFRRYFLSLVRQVRPRLVVFDGTWVYMGITDVCRAFDIPLVWVQRGMWKQEVDETSTQRHHAKSVVDHVIIPGDFAGSEIVDVGRGIEPHYVAPIVMTDPHDLLDREAACQSLGLDPAKRYVLLNLGGGSISDPDSIAFEALKLIHESADDLTPVQVVSPLAEPSDCPPGLIQLSAYPVMNFVRVFDAMVTAAGYNSAQEAVCMRIPSILVPNVNTITDDQARRARQLADQGLCWAAEGTDGLRGAVEQLADVDRRRAMQERLANVTPPTGASEAAVIVEGICKHSGWQRRAATMVGQNELRAR